MTDGHLQGRQKLRAASRAGAAAPGPSGPAPALPARGGRRGSRRPSGQARLAGAAGSVGLGHRPGETRASVATRTKKSPEPSAPRQACGTASAGQPRAWPDPGPWKAAEEGQNVSPSGPEGPGSGVSGPERRGRKPTRPKASRLATEPNLPALPLYAACPEPPRAPSPGRLSGPEAMRASLFGRPPRGPRLMRAPWIAKLAACGELSEL